MDSKNSVENVVPAEGVLSGAPSPSPVQPVAAVDRPSRPNDLRRPLRQSLLLVGSLVLGVVLALTPRYETNDDAGMNLIAAGRGFVDRPDEHLLYCNILIGLGLKSLYQAAPAVPWYGALWFVTASASLAAICFACLRNVSCEWTVGLAGAFLWFAGIPDLTQLQFTRIAFLAALAGLLLLASGIRSGRGRWQCWCAVPLLLVGDLIRYDALQLICVVLAPVILWMLWRCRSQKDARIALSIFAGCLLLGWGAWRLNDWYYAREADWKDFYPFNVLRVEITDFEHVQYNSQTAGAFAEAGWKPVDFQMLRNWAYLDQDRYNTETLRKIFDALPPSGRSARPWDVLLKQVAADSEFWGLLACAAAIVAILGMDSSARLIPLACFLAAIATCAMVYWSMRLPARVYCPVFGGCAATALVFSNGPRSFGKRHPWVETAVGRNVALAVLGALIVWRGYAVWRSNANYVSYHKSAVLMLANLAPKPDEIYVIWAGDFPFEFVTLPLASEPLTAHFKVMNLGNTSGFTRQRMRELGVRDIDALVRRGGRTYFVCQPGEVALLDAYLQAHYGEHLNSQVTFAHQALGDSAVFQFSIEAKKPRS